MKRNEREYAIDPLFHKRSAIFDSGGAKGLLLNVLSVHNGFQLVFDSSDLVDDSEAPTHHASGGEIESELHKLITAVLPSQWQESPICPEYSERKKGSSAELAQFIAEESYIMDTDDTSTYDHAMDIHPPSAPLGAASTAVAEDDSDDELRVTFGGGPANASANTTSAWQYDPVDDGGADEHPGFEDVTYLDAQLNRIEERELATSALGQPDMEYYETTDGPNAEYTYFNRDKLANWSGPEHWKHKNIRTGKKGVAAGDDDEYRDEEGNIIKANKSKGPRKQFRIDFNAPAPANLEELLAPAGTFHFQYCIFPFSLIIFTGSRIMRMNPKFFRLQHLSVWLNPPRIGFIPL